MNSQENLCLVPESITDEDKCAMQGISPWKSLRKYELTGSIDTELKVHEHVPYVNSSSPHISEKINKK